MYVITENTAKDLTLKEEKKSGSVAKLSEANKEIVQLKNEIQNCQNERQRLSSELLILRG
jgi:hypothetical protein